MLKYCQVVTVMYKIMIVEDDSVISRSLKMYIEEWGYKTFCVSDFKEVLHDFASFSPDLILLDISLPFYNGYYWCREIRKLSSVPIIFVSSVSDNMNIVMAMNMGADDFIAKPFDLNVLMAKLQAMLRRTYDFGTQATFIEHEGVILNISDNSLTYNEQKIDLSKNEYKILEVLMENTGKPVTRDTIMTRLWETDSFIDDNTLTVNVTRLRKKLETIGIADFIETKKGIGYIIK